MDKNAKIYIAGQTSLVGSALIKTLKKEGFNNLVFRTIEELDLTRQKDVEDFFRREKPEYVFLAAAKVGGILANNTYPAEFIYMNLAIQNNVIHSSYLNDVKRLLFLGSSCIYPQNCPQPMREEHLLSGNLELTNESYAIAKVTGFEGEIVFDACNPDGMLRKLLDINSMEALGWQPKVSLETVIKKNYEAFKCSVANQAYNEDHL